MPDGTFEVSVTASEQFKRIKKALKEAPAELRKEFLRNMRTAMARLRIEVPESAMETLPKRGGLAETIAKSKYSIRSRANGMIFRMDNKDVLRYIDQGVVRHPVFARKDESRDQWTWVEQKVEPHFWTDPTEKAKPEIIAAMVEAMDETARKLEG